MQLTEIIDEVLNQEIEWFYDGEYFNPIIVVWKRNRNINTKWWLRLITMLIVLWIRNIATQIISWFEDFGFKSVG